MPIYDYTCKGCSETFEQLVTHSNKDKIKCPKCKSDTVRIECYSTPTIWKCSKPTPRRRG